MDKETLSNYGWIVICVLIIAVMVALASPFGSYIRSGIENTTQGLYDTERTAMGIAGLKVNKQKFHTFTTNFEYSIKNKEMPTEFAYGDYIYIRSGSNGNYTWSVRLNTSYTGNSDDYTFGFDVKSTDREQTSYGKILESAFGYPITNLHELFRGCSSLTDCVEIPYAATDISYMYYGCSSLTVAPEIPDYVSNMKYTFYGCCSIVSAPEIPDTVTEMRATFALCSNLVNSTTIPKNVTNMEFTFYNCFSLNDTLKIDANPLLYDGCLLNTPVTKIIGVTTLKSELLSTLHTI